MMSTLVSLRAHAPTAVTGELPETLVAAGRRRRNDPAFRRARRGRFLIWSSAVITAWMQAVERRWRERCIVVALERLSDATLKDIGICRCEIAHAARTQASNKRRA
jgi:uncharacterized protein YjiS (DUF1127 family)